MTQLYDVCIIGGGIQGCGVAQAAAAAGYSVVLLEQSALASATSGRSSKLIHGGLRYLESAQFGLVTHSLTERELLLKNAPDLVKRVPFYIPVYKHTSRRSWQIFIGLSLYALLGRFRATACFRKLPAQKWQELDGIKQEGLQAVYQYWDAQTDDVQLTRAVMYSAVQMGASLKCPARFEQAVFADDCYQVDYQINGVVESLQCKTLVNASGPWVNSVQQKITPQVNAPDIELVQGAHLILKQPSPSGVYYVESPADRRAVFVMPWYGQTLIGTTETIFTGDPKDIKPTEHEVEYLRNIAHYYFPAGDNTIVDQFAGARVLPSSDKNVFSRPRDTIYYADESLPGYVALLGGKLTGYRHAAETALQHIKSSLPDKQCLADTREIKLIPAPENF